MGNCKSKVILTPIFFPSINNIQKFENKISSTTDNEHNVINNIMNNNVSNENVKGEYNEIKTTIISPKKYSQSEQLIFEIHNNTTNTTDNNFNNDNNYNTENNDNNKNNDYEAFDLTNFNKNDKLDNSHETNSEELLVVHKIFTNNLGVIFVKKPKFRHAPIFNDNTINRRESGTIINFLQKNHN